MDNPHFFVYLLGRLWIISYICSRLRTFSKDGQSRLLWYGKELNFRMELESSMKMQMVSLRGLLNMHILHKKKGKCKKSHMLKVLSSLV